MKKKIKQLTELETAFQKLFDNSDYRPHPIALEGGKAYKQKIPISKCPYTDSEKKDYWEHGWHVTNIGYIKASEYGEVYDDPQNWK